MQVEDLSGTDLGPYSLLRVLGRGGQSTVYCAVHRSSRQVLACKVLRPADEHDGALPLVGRVDHPHVVPIYGMGQHGGRRYAIMQLVAGPTVHTELRQGPLGIERALTIFSQLCGALAALHAHGMLHLDVKPANALLSQEHLGDHVYLLDYGLHEQGVATRARVFVGTPNYASPEHLRGGAVGPRSDVYSVSCVLFARLSGRPPFAGRLTEVLTGQLRGAVPSLAATTGLPRQIDAVLHAGLHSEPGRRPGDPRELAASASEALARR